MKLAAWSVSAVIIAIFVAVVLADFTTASKLAIPATFVVALLTLTLNIIDHREHR